MKNAGLIAALVLGAFCVPSFAQAPAAPEGALQPKDDAQDPLASIEQALDSFTTESLQLAAFDLDRPAPQPQQGFGPQMQPEGMGPENGPDLQLAEGKPGKGPFNQMGPQGECPMMQGQQQGGCPMTQGQQQGRHGGMMMGQGFRQGQFGAMRPGFGPQADGKGMLDAKFAELDPAKYAELKKLREQEEQIVKDLVEKEKADREEFKKLVDAYKKTPTDDVKDKIKAKIAEKFDAKIKAKAARLEEFSKKIDEMKKEKDQKVTAMLDRVLTDSKKDERGGHGGHGGPASSGAQATPPPQQN